MTYYWKVVAKDQRGGEAASETWGFTTKAGADYIVIAGGDGMLVVDVSDPENPRVVGSVDIYDALGVYVQGSYAYVADGDEGLKVIYLTDDPGRILSSISGVGKAYGVYSF